MKNEKWVLKQRPVGKPNIESDFEKEDFIHHNEVAANVPMESLEHEAKITSDCIGTWYEWLREKGCELTICSSTNPAPAHIKRVEI